MLQRKITIATRKSPLALWQANFIKHKLEQLSPEMDVELLPMVTKGDELLQSSLIKLGGKGLFVKELEKALLDKRADIAVHSMKDVPVVFPDGLGLVAICQRESPFDTLVSERFNALDELPQNAVVGTSSLRRQCQLMAYRPDLNIKNLRGNVNTRLNKLEQNEYDAIILAEAGLERLQLAHKIKQVLPPRLMLPACGQGALGIEMRTDDSQLQQIIEQLNDSQTATCVAAERLVNEKLGGNCQVPVAVFCQPKAADAIVINARVAMPNGENLLHAQTQGTLKEALTVANDCAKQLIEQGALELINSIKDEQSD